ncbi:MAG: hypothetical protein KDB86_11785 [Actinobacteria bacterium]|nr:hypothetical protein [Actinomycetota bacterium]MCB9389294.1 hypothetical protein [Acidimicrobiia bacterium]
MLQRRVRALILLLLVASISLAACGSDDDNEAGSSVAGDKTVNTDPGQFIGPGPQLSVDEYRQDFKAACDTAVNKLAQYPPPADTTEMQATIQETQKVVGEFRGTITALNPPDDAQAMQINVAKLLDQMVALGDDGLEKLINDDADGAIEVANESVGLLDQVAELTKGYGIDCSYAEG